MTEDEIREHGAILEVAGMRFYGWKATAMLAAILSIPTTILIVGTLLIFF